MEIENLSLHGMCDDVMFVIFKFLNNRELAVLSQANKAFYEIAKQSFHYNNYKLLLYCIKHENKELLDCVLKTAKMGDYFVYFACTTKNLVIRFDVPDLIFVAIAVIDTVKDPWVNVLLCQWISKNCRFENCETIQSRFLQTDIECQYSFHLQIDGSQYNFSCNRLMALIRVNESIEEFMNRESM